MLFFDWVQNEDRTLTELGGNPNLLWTLGGQELRVFDLNLAFDREFNHENFRNLHIFQQEFGTVPIIPKPTYTGRMKHGLSKLDSIWSELPEEWLYPYGDVDAPAELAYDEVAAMLGRFETDPDNFWTIAK